MYSAGSLYLMKDDGSSWMGPMPIGQPGTLQNSQCTLDVGASSATGAGTNLTVNLVLSFSSTFTGTKNEYMQAQDVADNLSSGFQNLGSWTPNAITAVPAAVSVTPGSGSGTGPQTFTLPVLGFRSAVPEHLSGAGDAEQHAELAGVVRDDVQRWQPIPG